MIVWVVETHDHNPAPSYAIVPASAWGSLGAALRSISRERWRAAYRRRGTAADGTVYRHVVVLRYLFKEGVSVMLNEREDGSLITLIRPVEVRP